MKKKLTFFIFMLIVFIAGCQPAHETPNPLVVNLTPPAGMQVVQGKLLNQVARLEDALPRAGTEGFVVPTDEQKNIFSVIVAGLNENRPLEALTSATQNGYDLLWYSDANDGNAISYVLRETDPSLRGWGLYIFRVASASNVILEAPHPLSDEGTPALSVDLYRALDARAVLIAGAHRDANAGGSADAAHNPQTIFQAVHESEVGQIFNANQTPIVLQIHGFAASKHPDYPHVIVSYEHSGVINLADLLAGQMVENKIVAALKSLGIKVGTCNGGEWRDLCGQTNVQSELMTRGIFIHIELDETIRDKSKKFIEAMVAALTE